MRIAHFCLASLFVVFCLDRPALAHCDTIDGPVVAAARLALKAGDPAHVLRWVQPQFENEVRAAFDRTVAVRATGPEAAALADQWFFETVIRLHRQGESEPFVGLRDEPVEPLLALADAAVTDGSLERLKKPVMDDVAASIDRKFRDVLEAKKHANESVENGRRFVAAYVAFIQTIETLHASSAETSPLK